MSGKHLSTISGASLAGMILWASVGLADEPAGTAADKEARRAAEVLKEQIQTLRETEEAGTAMAAYARGCAVDRMNTELQDAYMRRMLEFGLPQIAYYPAKILVHIAPGNGMAWGVLAYRHGRGGEYAEALSASLRAVEHSRDNPSILNNAGQLLAWYEFDPEAPSLSDAQKRLVAKINDDLHKREAFAKAYGKIKAVYDELAAGKQERRKALAAARTDAQAAAKKVEELRLKLTGLNKDIEYNEDVVKDLRSDLHWGGYYWGWGAVYLQTPGTGGQTQIVPYYQCYPRSALYREEVRLRIRDAERKIDKLELEADGVRREGRLAVQDSTAKREALARLTEEGKLPPKKLQKLLRWDPPAVDGVVVARREHLPRPAAKRAPTDPESIAARRLKLARLYLRNDMPDKAVPILKGILAKHGTTKAAKEARSLLAEQPPPTQP